MGNITYRVYIFLENTGIMAFKVIYDNSVAVCFIKRIKNLKGVQVRSNCSKGIVEIVCIGCMLPKLLTRV